LSTYGFSSELLENEHTIVLDGDEVPESANDPMFSMDTKLTAYFKYNATLPEDSRILYRDIPKHCTWNSVVKEVEQWFNAAKFRRTGSLFSESLSGRNECSDMN
jgi:hypothetical protein